MTQKEKKLLLIDLCARVPYGVLCGWSDDVQITNKIIGVLEDRFLLEDCDWVEITAVKPYLRPMSSMTEKEKRAFDKFICIDEDAWLGKENGCVNQAKIMSGGIDWLNKHHFDYRGLIEKGLALEATEDMYKFD